MNCRGAEDVESEGFFYFRKHKTTFPLVCLMACARSSTYTGHSMLLNMDCPFEGQLAEFSHPHEV